MVCWDRHPHNYEMQIRCRFAHFTSNHSIPNAARATDCSSLTEGWWHKWSLAPAATRAGVSTLPALLCGHAFSSAAFYCLSSGHWISF